MAASGLFCAVGRDVFRYENGQSAWQMVLPDDFSGFDLDQMALFQASPDGQHGALVARRGDERMVYMVSLPGPVLRPLPSPLTRVAGMAWSPNGKRLCIVGGDPSVGVLSMDDHQPLSTLPVFSLFMAGKDDADLVAVTGPIALPGTPRWSPAGDAVAVVGLDRGKGQVALVVTADGQEGPLVSGDRVLLGTSAWTASGMLLCAVFQPRDGVHVQLVNTATGETTEQGEAWEDVCWLSLVGERVLVAGKASGAWCVADVTGGTRTVLTASFDRIVDVAASAQGLWLVASVENGDLGLWSMDLHGEHLRLHSVAPSMRGMRMRQDGTTVAVMVGPAGAETVRVFTLGDEDVLDLGRRDAIMGWMEEHLPHGRLPRLHYLLMPTWQAADDWLAPSEPAGAEETGTIAMDDVPEALPLSGSLEPLEEPSPEASDAVEASGRSGGPGRRRRWIAVVVALVIIAVAATATALAVQGARRAAIAAKQAPVTDTPSAQPVDVPSTSIEINPAATPSTPSATPEAPPVVTPPVVKPVIETYGVAVGSWVAPTERLRVRQGAGTDKAVLGYLATTERARVLAGPTVLTTTPWWSVRCYDANGQPVLTGWVSGEYVRPSSAPVTPTPAPAPAKPKPVVTSTKGTIVVDSKPEGARVAINAIGLGVTPCSLEIPGGRETMVTVTLEGYLDYTTTVTVKAGATMHLNLPLQPLTPLGSGGN